jgi:hypothetical protein
MSSNLTQRMMDAEAEANDEIKQKDFQHTVAFEQLTRQTTIPGSMTSPPPDINSTMTGAELRAALLARAQQQREEANANATSSGRLVEGYEMSALGQLQTAQTSADSKLRRRDGESFESTREYMEKRREREEMVRERRDSLREKHSPDSHNNKPSVTPATKSSASVQPNIVPKQHRTHFHEPPSRGYDPYA